jgi:CHAD domain-containing protein
MALVRKMGDTRRTAGGIASTFGPWAKARILRSAIRFLDVAIPGSTDVAPLHALRLRTKKLRYEIEILANVLAPAVRADAYPTLSELQDHLGEINDCSVMVERLQALQRSMPGSAMVPSIDVLCREVDAMLERSRAQVVAWWTAERAERLRNTIDEIA